MSKDIDFNVTSTIASGINGLGNFLPPANSAMPPLGPIGIAPEPILPPLTDEELLDAILNSPNTIIRQAMAQTSYNPDTFIQHKGYDSLDSMKSFGAYYTPLHLLVTSALYKDWTVQPRVLGKVVNPEHPRYVAAKQVSDFVNYVCRTIVDPENDYDRQDFRNVLWQMLEPGVHLGHSVQEIQYRIIKEGQYVGKMGLQRIIYRPPNVIRFNIDPKTDQIRSLNAFTPLGGWQNRIRRSKFLIYTFRPQKGLPYGWGLARVCYKHTFALDILVRLLGEALQRFGMGFLMAEVTTSQDSVVKKVLQMLDGVKNGKPLVTTPDIKVTSVNLPGGGLDPIEKALRWHSEQIATHILGQTLTTSAGDGQGSYATSKVHAGTQKYFTGYPRRDAEVGMEYQLFTQLVLKNFGIDFFDVIPGLDLGVYDHEESAIVADYMSKYANVGVINPRESFVRDRALFPPYDPSTPEVPFLPDRVQERVNINKGTSTGGSN